MNAVLDAHYEESYFRSHYEHVTSERYHGLLGQYWRHAIFTESKLHADRWAVLDYGSGLGQVSAALPNAACFDASAYARQFLQKRGRTVFEHPDEIPETFFDAVLSSHVLEHCLNPVEQLTRFHRYIKRDGKLVLIVPRETTGAPALVSDGDLHVYSWTFQTITNLLRCCGWQPVQQRWIYGPFLLRTLGNWLSVNSAVRIAARFGRCKRAYPALLTVAQAQESALDAY